MTRRTFLSNLALGVAALPAMLGLKRNPEKKVAEYHSWDYEAKMFRLTGVDHFILNDAGEWRCVAEHRFPMPSKGWPAPILHKRNS